MLNLAGFGSDEHQLMIQAGIDGLRDILELDLDSFRGRVRRAATELGIEPPDDLRVEGWWEQAQDPRGGVARSAPDRTRPRSPQTPAITAVRPSAGATVGRPARMAR